MTTSRRLIGGVNALLAQEKGTVVKDHGGRITLCLVYPNTYHVGMSNLGFQGLYGLLNRRDDVVCERAFLPSDDDIAEYRRTGTPLFSFESKKPLGSFNLVAFSLSFENDYPGVLTTLDLAKIPLAASERTDYHPLVIAGGVCASANPEPLSPLVDIFFVGEAEESLEEFLEVYKGCLQRRASQGVRLRDAVKNAVLSLDGLYVPEFYQIAYNPGGTIAGRTSRGGAPERIRRRYLKDLSRSPVTTAITTPHTEFSNKYLIEAMRGCPWRCRFCLVGYLYSPPRGKDLETLRDEIEAAKEKTDRIGLIGPSLTDHPSIGDVLRLDGVSFSITSLRASAKSAELIELLKGHRSVSIAPEAGTERMRRVINKRITEHDIIETSRLIFDAGIENLRLYFMIGLPTERLEDVDGIVDLVKRIRRLSGKGAVIVSLGTFVPKPFTPFQWHPMERLDSIKEKIRFVKKALRDTKNVRVFHDVPKYAHMQGLFSLGDKRVFGVLERMRAGADWIRACSGSGVDPDFYLFREKESEEILPWDFIEVGTPKARLREEYMKALGDST